MYDQDCDQLNSIRAAPMQHKLLRHLSEYVEAELTNPFSNTAGGWLNKGKN